MGGVDIYKVCECFLTWLSKCSVDPFKEDVVLVYE